MDLLFDIKTSDGREIKDCYFVLYFRNIRGGKHNSILASAVDSIRCFNKIEEEILDLKLSDYKITKIIDVDTGTDVTEYRELILSTVKLMCREERYID
jgi:hypothetical protein